MRKLLVALVCAAIIGVAHAQAPTDQSVERLLTAANAEATFSNMQANMGRMAQNMIQRTGQPMTERDRAVMDRMMAIVSDEFSWAKFKPKLVQLYAESFTQEEIDGLVAFYESPAGRAYVAKLPLLTAKTLEMAQQQMGSLLPRMKAVAEEARAQAPAAK